MNDILKEARTILQTTPVRWTNLTHSLSKQLLALPPVPGEWSALDCLQHLVDTELWVFPVRLKALRAGQDFAAFDPNSQGIQSNRPLSPGELVAEFAVLRA